MDSACLAAFMKPGTHAYTFRFLGGEFGNIDYERAEKYCQKYGLIHHAVDIDWNTVEKNIDKLMLTKGAPVHSIETTNNGRSYSSSKRRSGNDGSGRW